MFSMVLTFLLIIQERMQTAHSLNLQEKLKREVFLSTGAEDNTKGTYWVGQKSPFSFFHKIKYTFFIFTKNFIDLDILSVSAISRYWILVGGGQGGC